MRWAAALVAACLAAAGCGATAAKASAPAAAQPLTEAQAVALSSVLWRNHELGGAQVTAVVPYTTTETVTITGPVDFAGHSGHLRVVTAAPGDAPTTQLVDYTADAVYEATADDGSAWTSRAPDPTGRPLDRIIQLLVALASTTRDNPLLVRQGQARFAGSRPDGADTVDVYRYSPTITYWVGHDDDRLHRFVATVDGIAGPVTIDLSGWGPQTCPPPPASEVTAG